MRTELTESEIWNIPYPSHLKNRIKQTISYLSNEQTFLKNQRYADMGISNPMKKVIEEKFNIKIDSIDYDFNNPITNYYVNPPYKKYDVIFCFEVLEHVINQLLFMLEIKKFLNDEGILYLSTPYQIPQILKSKFHWYEIPNKNLLYLFEKAKYKIINKTKITIAGNLKDHICGIRPFLRYFQKTRIFTLKTFNLKR